MDLAQILQRLCPPTNTQLQTRTPPPHSSLGVKGHQRGCPHSASEDMCLEGWGGAKQGVCAPPPPNKTLPCSPAGRSCWRWCQTRCCHPSA